MAQNPFHKTKPVYRVIATDAKGVEIGAEVFVTLKAAEENARALSDLPQYVKTTVMEWRQIVSFDAAGKFQKEAKR